MTGTRQDDHIRIGMQGEVGGGGEGWENRFKGAVSRDFLPFFLFHESKPSGPLTNRLKWFCLKIRFRGDSLRFFVTCLKC